MLEGRVPERGRIPIEVVRNLAHASRHHVWATGNQRLTDEADIPGLQIAKDRWNKQFDGDVEDKYSHKKVKQRDVEDGVTFADESEEIWERTKTWQKPIQRMD